MSRTPLIAGNWKMHKTVAEARAFVQRCCRGVAADGVDVGVCVPFTALGRVATRRAAPRVEVYAQNMH